MRLGPGRCQEGRTWLAGFSTEGHQPWNTRCSNRNYGKRSLDKSSYGCLAVHYIAERSDLVSDGSFVNTIITLGRSPLPSATIWLPIVWSF
jgi:hypothetical protein